MKLLQIAGLARQVCLRAALFVLAFVATSSLLLAQAPDPQTPADMLNPGTVALLAAAVTTLLTYLGKFVPVVNKWSPYVRAAVTGLLVVGAFVTFGWAAASEDTLRFILAEFAPQVLAFSGLIWQTFKWLAGLVGVKISAQAKA